MKRNVVSAKIYSSRVGRVTEVSYLEDIGRRQPSRWDGDHDIFELPQGISRGLLTIAGVDPGNSQINLVRLPRGGEISPFRPNARGGNKFIWASAIGAPSLRAGNSLRRWAPHPVMPGKEAHVYGRGQISLENPEDMDTPAYGYIISTQIEDGADFLASRSSRFPSARRGDRRLAQAKQIVAARVADPQEIINQALTDMYASGTGEARVESQGISTLDS